MNYFSIIYNIKCCSCTVVRKNLDSMILPFRLSPTPNYHLQSENGAHPENRGHCDKRKEESTTQAQEKSPCAHLCGSQVCPKYNLLITQPELSHITSELESQAFILKKNNCRSWFYWLVHVCWYSPICFAIYKHKTVNTTALGDRQEGGSIVNAVRTWRTQTLLSPDHQISMKGTATTLHT